MASVRGSCRQLAGELADRWRLRATAVENGGAAKPLYEMTPEEWRAHNRGLWEARLPRVRRPMTIQEWISGQYENEA
ncbi:hypothetical protein OH768_28290 [Streptomyces sp. NBC_01622]|uniref:hypothetical protein n=1 Tax=Streptomyces sp. NBC_01622 TaxID=2975903 RepID=UPI003865F290|nr:hypothetical protein OH768_28290 [Streptomyces sp. NBC_01622]